MTLVTNCDLMRKKSACLAEEKVRTSTKEQTEGEKLYQARGESNE